MTKSTPKYFRSNGKLLLTGEFLVIDGAKALAVPSCYGQRLAVKAMDKPGIYWKSYTHNNQLWYEGCFKIEDGEVVSTQDDLVKDKADDAITNRLQQIFNVLIQLNPKVFKAPGYFFETHLEFPREWGLGTSSTLIANIAAWAQVNPYVLLAKTFGGSAYDIACAQSSSALLYTRTNTAMPKIQPVDFTPPFKEKLFFVYRNQKQNTRHVVAHYKRLNPSVKRDWIEAVSKLSDAFLNCTNLDQFEDLMARHEAFLSSVLEMPPVKQTHFPDYPGAIKSLGAWGGDFMLATGGTDEKTYFKKKGYTTLIDFSDLVLGPAI